MESVYLFPGEASLNHLNLNKVTEDLWGEEISPTKCLAFCVLPPSIRLIAAPAVPWLL